MASSYKRSFPFQSAAASEPSDAPATKRSRTAHACDPCRIRKSRCNGARPSCDICTTMGLTCHYRAPAKPPVQAVAEDQVSRMESRLQAMEQMLKAAIMGAGRPSPAHEENDGTFIGITTPVSVEDMGTTGADRGNAAGDSVDGLAAMTFRDEEASGFFGPTSNSALFSHITAAIRELTEFNLSPPAAEAIDGAGDLVSRPASPPPAKTGEPRPNPNALPPEQEVASHIDIFFTSTGQIFPFLHKPTILKTLASLRRDSFRNVKRSYLCLLNMIMALASVFGSSNVPVPERIEQGNVFLSRGLALLQQDLGKTANLESLQALILLVQYFQGTQGSAQTWRLHGVAVNIGLQLGLQRRRQPQCWSPLDTEIHKRVWWMCLMLDRTCSMTLGRPPLVSNDFMNCGLPSDVELDLWEDGDDKPRATSSTQRASSTSLFIQTGKLNLVIGDVISKIYQGNIGHESEVSCLELIQTTMEMEKSLSEWRNALPMHHKLVFSRDMDATSEPKQHDRFRIVLTLRYLNARALLHREVISRFLRASAAASADEDTEWALLQTFGLSSLEISAETAIDTTNIICRVANEEGLLPVWWISIYYAFNSALILFGVIIALHKHRIQLHKLTLHNLLQSVTTAYKTIPTIGGSSRLVLRCQKILNKLTQMASHLGIRVEEFPNHRACESIEKNPGPLPNRSEDTREQMMQDFQAQLNDVTFFSSLDIDSTFGFSCCFSTLSQTFALTALVFFRALSNGKYISISTPLSASKI